MSRNVLVQFKATNLELTFQLLRQALNTWLVKIALVAFVGRVVWDLYNWLAAGKPFDLSFLVAVPLAFLFVPIVMIRFRFGKSFNEQTWHFSDEGISLQTEQLSSKYKWKQFSRAAADAWFYYLYYAKNASVFIPRRAIATSEDNDAFKTLVKKHIQTSFK